MSALQLFTMDKFYSFNAKYENSDKKHKFSLTPRLALRVKILIPIFKTFTAFVLFRFCTEKRLAEKKMVSHRPIWEFHPKIEFKRLRKFKMTVKFSENFMLC